MIAVSLITQVFIVLSVLSGGTLLTLVYLDNRKSRIDGGIAAFRKHIDALSPESRRTSVHYGGSDDWRSK